MDAVTIGKRLAALRGGKPRDAVAQAVGISSAAIGMYECGARVPRDSIKIALAEYYGRTVQEIFFDSEFAC